MVKKYQESEDMSLAPVQSGQSAVFFDGPIQIPVRLKSPATLERSSYLVMPIMRGMRRKQRGGWRLLFKAYLGVFKILSQLLRITVHGTLKFSVQNRDVRVDIDLTNFQYLYLPLNGEAHVYEPRVTALLNFLSPRISNVYDVGANWGYYTLLLASHPHFHGCIHAFEIAPKTFRDLKVVSEALEKHTNVPIKCHKLGLSDNAGRVRVRHHAFSGMTMIVPEDRTFGELLPVTTVDELELPPPDLIKIDVEGHETEVLKGARQTLAQYLPIVILENHFDSDYDEMLEPLRILADLGYHLFHPAWEMNTLRGRAYSNEPLPGSGPEKTLCLFRISPETRLLTSGAPDVIAVHPSRRDTLIAPASI